MTATRNIKAGGLVSMSIKVEGMIVPDMTQILSIEVTKGINRIANATITLLDGDASTAKFKISSSSIFLPGKEVIIEAGYDTHNKQIFKGIITNQTIKMNSYQGSSTVVICRDPAVKLTVGRKSKTFSKKKDSEIISSIISTYSGISSKVSATNFEWPEQVQYNVSDWDFILARAETNGMVVSNMDGEISVLKPNEESSPVLNVSYGYNMLEIYADLNAVTQLGSVKSRTWDFKNQEIIDGQAENDVKGAGNLSSKKLSNVLGLDDFQLVTTAPLEKAALVEWSKAQLIKSEFSKIRGEVKFQGSNLVDPGKWVTLSGVGDRINGNHFISGVTHFVKDGNWVTEVEFGLSPLWFTEQPDVTAQPASGLLPGVRGLYNAVVKKIDEDPDSQYRILVEVPMFDSSGEGIWARLTNFYSTSDAGVFFLPEVGDEVIVGFLNEDPRYPIILGSVYSGSKIKPFEGLDPNEKNSIKAIVSKSKIVIQFDDENKILTLTTPGKNLIEFNDKEKQISIKDENGNSLVMSDSGIQIQSEKDISIEAEQNLTLKGTQGVKIESSPGDVEVSGMNIKQSADTQYSAEGGEMAKVSSGMELSLKSAMIMIN